MVERKHERPGAHGERDIDVRAIAWSGVIFIVIAVITHVGLWGLYEVFLANARAEDGPALSLVEIESPQWSDPGLQDGVGTSSPIEEMVKWRAEEARRLEEWGWVDRDAGSVRIPVERAMRLMAERGLPYRQSNGGDEPGSQDTDPAPAETHEEVHQP